MRVIKSLKSDPGFEATTGTSCRSPSPLRVFLSLTAVFGYRDLAKGKTRQCHNGEEQNNNSSHWSETWSGKRPIRGEQWVLTRSVVWRVCRSQEVTVVQSYGVDFTSVFKSKNSIGSFLIQWHTKKWHMTIHCCPVLLSANETWRGLIHNCPSLMED